MKKLSFLLLLLIPLLSYSQNYKEVISTEVIDGESVTVVRATPTTKRNVEKYNLFETARQSATREYSKAVSAGVVVEINKTSLNEFRSNAPYELTMDLPLTDEGAAVTLELTKANIFAPDFKIFTSDKPGVPMDFDLGLHYHGKIAGQEGSMVAISVYEGEVMGMVVNRNGTYNLGKLEDSRTKHIVYLNSDLKQVQDFSCATEDDGIAYTREQLEFSSNGRDVGDCTNIYIEVDESVTNSTGSAAATTTVVTNIFNQSAILYANEMLPIAISEMFIWTTPDPYSGPSAGQYRAQFQANTGAFNGDLGHLVALDNVGGQAAGFAGICNADTDESLCFSGFSGLGFNNVPIFSFNVQIFTHELGHLFGSRHTHACVWNGNSTAIDGCSGATEGGCALPGLPPGGGTIMSYCNGTAVGIDFALGFGPQPGNVIRSTIANATCLGATCACNLSVSCALITDQNLTCRADLPPVDFDLPIIISSCANVTLSALTIIPGDSGCPGDEITITRTYFIQDTQGNMDQCMQTFTILSTNAPTIICPSNMVVECAADIVVNAANAVTTSDCSVPSVSVSGPVINGTPDCPNTTYTYTYTATDFCNRMASCQQVFTIVNNAPTIVCAPNETVECVADINPTAADVTVTTSCTLGSNVAIAGPVIIGAAGCDGAVYQYTYTATDDCNRMVSCTRSYTLSNNGPTISCPGPVTVECEDDIMVDANDANVFVACNLGFELKVDGPEIFGNAGCAGSVYQFTYTVMDECGRMASCVQFISIANDAPMITCPANAVVECSSDIMVNPNDAAVTTSCDYGFNVIISGPVINGTKDCPGSTYTYTYIARDECGRLATCDQVFTIGNNDGPSIDAPADQTIECIEQANLNPDFATVTTSCGQDYTVSVSEPVLSGSANCPGARYTYTYTVMDACGRSATDTRVFTIRNDGPELDCPDSYLFLNCEDFGPGGLEAKIQAWLGQVTARSSCGLSLGVSNNFNMNSLGMCISNPFTNVTFFATDNCGRTGTCQATIVMTDTEEPIVYEEAQDDMESCYNNFQATFQQWLASRGGAVIVDDCWSNLSWSTIPSFPTINCNGGMGSSTVTFRATDGCGNFATTTATFYVMTGNDMSDQDNGSKVGEANVELSDLDLQTGEALKLFQNRPNPFKASTVIGFYLPETTDATLTIYDMSGRVLRVINNSYSAGYNEVEVQRSDLQATGVLFYRLNTPNASAVSKMIVLD